MDTFNFESNVGKPVEIDLIFDGEKRGTFELSPVISFVDRAAAIQSVIDSVVDEYDFMPYNYNFALTYNLLPFYTDIAFPDVEIVDVEDETPEARQSRQRNANLSSAFDFLSRSNVTEALWANIPHFGELVEEVNAGIEFAKRKLLSNNSWNRVGDKINDLFGTLGEVLVDPDTLDGLLTAINNLGEASAEANES